MWFSSVRFVSKLKYVQELRQNQVRNTRAEILKSYEDGKIGLENRKLLK